LVAASLARNLGVARCHSWLLAALLVGTWTAPAGAQVRGVYPLGMSATNSGVMPDAGWSYVNLPLYYARDRLTGPNGETVSTGAQAVFLDMNTLAWVSEKIDRLGNAKFSASFTLPIAHNSLTSDATGHISGATGLGDLYVQPLILGWESRWADIRAVYGVLAPTGRFEAGASDNVGSGYWTHALASGQTFYLTDDRRINLSLFEMYEIHTTQQGTDIHPGDTLNLDYSLTGLVPLQSGPRLQVGLAGYASRQMSAKTGPAVSAADSAARYRVDALGLAANVVVPQRGLSFGIRYFKEFSSESTFEGYSLQGFFALKL
jgi:hypothetical protein